MTPPPVGGAGGSEAVLRLRLSSGSRDRELALLPVGGAGGSEAVLRLRLSSGSRDRELALLPVGGAGGSEAVLRLRLSSGSRDRELALLPAGGAGGSEAVLRLRLPSGSLVLGPLVLQVEFALLRLNRRGGRNNDATQTHNRHQAKAQQNLSQ